MFEKDNVVIITIENEKSSEEYQLIEKAKDLTKALSKENALTKEVSKEDHAVKSEAKKFSSWGDRFRKVGEDKPKEKEPDYDSMVGNLDDFIPLLTIEGTPFEHEVAEEVVDKEVPPEYDI